MAAFCFKSVNSDGTEWYKHPNESYQFQSIYIYIMMRAIYFYFDDECNR